MSAPVPNLLEGLLAWWKLDDYAGAGSVLRDSGPFGRHGHYFSTPGVSQSAPPFVPAFDLLEVDGGCGKAIVLNPDACTVTDCVHVPPCHGAGSYHQHGWTRSGRSGASTDDFGFYDPASFTFVVFCAADLVNDDTCPGLLTDFPATPGFAGGTYTYYGQVDVPGVGIVDVGDRVWFRRIWDSRPRMWKAIAPIVEVPYNPAGVFSFTLGDTGEDFEDGFWELDEAWMSCYDDPGQHGYSPYYTFGLAGDHSGFPFNVGWTMFTTFTPYVDPPTIHPPAYVINPDTVPNCRALHLWLFSESNGAQPPLFIPMGLLEDGKWQMFAITSDGTTVKTYKNCAQVSHGPANRLTAAETGMGFGFADRNLALSGKDELWQGLISNAAMWDHPLTHAELCHLFSNWCEPRHSLRTTHRATPTSNASATHSDDGKLHLENTRWRADPDATPPSPGSGVKPAHLEDVRFRSRV